MNDLFSPAPISVSELNAIAKNLLENQLHGFWIGGEISNLTRASSGHYYFALKDSYAQVRCVLFKHTAAQLAVPLKDGDHIELTGKISIYEARGEFQITVNDLRSVGLGSLYEQYEKLKMRLQNEGLFAAERKFRLPEHPKKIGIVTSLAAAALRDVVSTLARRAPHIPIIVYPTAVQGAGSEQQIAQAIDLAHQRAEVDVLLICRGGGSMEDLWAFNEELVVRAIATCAIPTVSGVGHETDFTLSDFVADVRAPTPTAAAELVSPNRVEMQRHVMQKQQALWQALRQRYQNASQTLDFHARQLRHPRDIWRDQSAQLAHWQKQLRAPDVAQYQKQLADFQAALNLGMQMQINQKNQQIQNLNKLLDALSPQQILQRGFAMVHDGRGKIVSDSGSLKLGQKLYVTLADGEIAVRVDNALNGELFD